MKKKISISLVLGVCWFSAFSQIDLQNGLIAYWKFQGNANDTSGNGNDATLHGNATFTAGHSGTDCQAIQFDGIEDYASLETGFNLPNTFSLSLWIKPDDVNTHFACLFTKRENPGSTN